MINVAWVDALKRIDLEYSSSDQEFGMCAFCDELEYSDYDNRTHNWISDFDKSHTETCVLREIKRLLGEVE